VVLASDNLTYLPTPQLTTREQPFHTKHLQASYISRPYTIIAFLFFGAFRFRVPRQSIENTFTPEFYSRCCESPVWSRVDQLHAVDRDKAGPENLRAQCSRNQRKHASIPRSHVVTCKIRLRSSSPRICSKRGVHPNRFETRDTSPITYH
jgi:hypothetical protein